MKKVCPLIQKECLEHGCEFYTHLVGIDPQSGAQKDDFGCAVKFLPILLVENAGQMRKATASIDKVASETHLVAAVAAGGQRALEQAILEANRPLSLEQK